MSHRPVPPNLLRVLVEQADRVGGTLVPVTDPTVRTRLTADLDEAAHMQADLPGYWLRAGEVTSAVLLAATRLGLASTPLSQALEIPTSQTAVRHDVLRNGADPHLVIRVGWPIGGAPELPATPRRELRAVLLRG